MYAVKFFSTFVLREGKYVDHAFIHMADADRIEISNLRNRKIVK